MKKQQIRILKSKDIVKYLIPEILTFYTNFSEEYTLSIIFCAVNKDHKLYGNTYLIGY